MLQAMMAFYIAKDEGIEEMYHCETKMGLPQINYVPQSQAGRCDVSLLIRT